MREKIQVQDRLYLPTGNNSQQNYIITLNFAYIKICNTYMFIDWICSFHDIIQSLWSGVMNKTGFNNFALYNEINVKYQVSNSSRDMLEKQTTLWRQWNGMIFFYYLIEY